MDFTEQLPISSSTIQDLYHENKILGSTLHDTVSKLEEKKIKMIGRRDHLQMLLNLKFEQISKIKEELEQTERNQNDLNFQCKNELLKRQDVEQKNLLNYKAFHLQQDFQTAFSVELAKHLEEINFLLLHEEKLSNLVEEMWNELQDTLHTYKNEEKNLQSEIANMKTNFRLEKEKFLADIEIKRKNIVDNKNKLENLIEKCAEMAETLKKLPLDEYKLHIDEGVKKAGDLQKKIQDLKDNINLKTEEIKQKKSYESFELERLPNELNNLKEQTTKLQMDIQKKITEINELKKVREDLKGKIDEYHENLEGIINAIQRNDEEKSFLNAEISKLTGTETKNEQLKSDITILEQEIIEINLEFQNKINLLEEIREKGEAVLTEFDSKSKKLVNYHEENQDLINSISNLQTEMDNLILIQNDREKSIKADITELNLSVDKYNDKINEFKAKRDSLTSATEKYITEFNELQTHIDEWLEKKAKAHQKLAELKQKLENTESSHKMKLENEKMQLEELAIALDNCDLILQGDLGQVVDLFEQLSTAKEEKIKTSIIKKNNLRDHYQEVDKKIENELMYLQNTVEETLEIEKRKGSTISEEIQKQNEKNKKLDERCQAYEKKINTQEHNINQLKKRIIVRENKLNRASKERTLNKTESKNYYEGGS